MRIFIAGATGAVGRHLVPAMVAAGHHVTATTTSAAKLGVLRAAGAQEAVVADGLDRDAVIAAVGAARPDTIIHQMTALAAVSDYRRFDQEFALTNKLRTAGTDYLLEAAAQAGVTRFIAQSYTGWPNAREGSRIKSEDDPLDACPLAAATESLRAIRHVEQAVPAAVPEGIVLRYGSFYGPGASDFMLDLVAKRRMPVVGGGTGIWSFTEITDAANATLRALTAGDPGVYNIVDDDPAPVSDWLPYLASLLGASRPWRIPSWLGRLAAGEVIVAQMTTVRGSSNAKARRELGWRPAYPSYRDGFPVWVKGGR